MNAPRGPLPPVRSTGHVAEAASTVARVASRPDKTSRTSKPRTAATAAPPAVQRSSEVTEDVAEALGDWDVSKARRNAPPGGLHIDQQEITLGQLEVLVQKRDRGVREVVTSDTIEEADWNPGAPVVALDSGRGANLVRKMMGLHKR